MTDQIVEEVPIKKLKRAPYMKRTVHDKEKAKELSISIKEHGVLENLIGRRVDGGIEIVAGNRRWTGAELAGLKTVPVKILDLTDEKAKEICLIENLQREDLDPIDEAESFGELLETLSVVEVAARVSKNVPFVQQRIRLLKLSENAKKYVRDRKITISAAIALARIEDKKGQDEILKFIGEVTDPVDVGRMSDIVERRMLELKNAPFDIKDKDLVPKAGACTQCPKRSGNQFSLPGIDAKVDKERCTDATCYRSKLDAKWGHDVARAKGAGMTVISDKDAQELFSPYGGWTDEGRKQWADVDRDYHKGSETVREALARLKIQTDSKDQHIVRDPSGHGHLVLARSLVKKLLKEDTKKSGDDEEASKLAIADKARARLIFAVGGEALDQVVDMKLGDAPDPDKLLRFAVLAMMEQTFLADETWMMYGFKKDHNTIMAQVASKKISVTDLGRIMAILTQRPSKKATSYSDSFQAMCDAFGLEVADLEKKIQNGNKKKSNRGT